MNIILFTKYIGSPMTLRMGHTKFYIISLSLITLACSGIFYGAYFLGQASVLGNSDFGANRSNLDETGRQIAEVDKVKRSAREILRQLSRQVGLLKAHVIRLNAFGERIRKVVNVDTSQFNFNSVPGQGGLERPANGSVNSKDIFEEINRLSAVLKDREVKLIALETMILHAKLRRQGIPEGKPTGKGRAWISSRFGVRHDPFTGRRTYHDGVDFAAPLGTPIYSVAAGVVSASGRRGGYGNTVEVDHGNGIVSRYAHNHRNLVKVGDKVKKGQKIALMGSTGRSTGSHVHYEILKNGKAISPHAFMNRKKAKK